MQNLSSARMTALTMQEELDEDEDESTVSTDALTEVLDAFLFLFNVMESTRVLDVYKPRI
jgi:hypothetical protein